MPIHHTIVKKAALQGVTLTTDGETVRATHDASGVTVFLEFDDEIGNDNARDAHCAVIDIAAWQAENPGVFIRQNEEGEFVICIDAADYQSEDSYADYNDAFAAALETHLDAPEDDEGEDDAPASVVPDHYKKAYAAAGRPNDCGDWLAVTLEGLCHMGEKKRFAFDLETFERICGANGVDTSKYHSGTRGWEGRLRMTARNLLRTIVAREGKLIVPKHKKEPRVELEAPAAWCEANLSKKDKKAREEQDAAAKQIAA